MKTYALHTLLVLFLVFSGCDTSDSEDPVNELELEVNTFVVEVAERTGNTDYRGRASADLINQDHSPVDSVLVTSTYLEVGLQLSSNPEIYFLIYREAGSEGQLTRLGTFDLSAASAESLSPDGFRGAYIHRQAFPTYEMAVCESGLVTLDTVTNDQLTGSFTCSASQRQFFDENGAATTLREPIALNGRFSVGVARL